MNLKDMTNEQLLAEEDSCQYDDSYPFSETAHGEEILRRLNEADSLRKENEELRKKNERLLKDYYELRVNAALLVACDDALESLDSSEAKESEASHETTSYDEDDFTGITKIYEDQ